MATIDDILIPKAATPVVARPVQDPVTQPVQPAAVPASAVAPVAVPVAPIQPTPVAAPKVQSQQVAPVKSYSDMYKMLNANPSLGPADEEKERKREKSRAVISAIGDGVSALTNLYFTTKGAPNMGSSNLSERNMARREDMLRRRQAKQDAYSQGLMAAIDRDNQKGETERRWNYQTGRDKVSDEKYAEGLDLSKDKVAASIQQNAYNNALKAADLSRKERADKARLSSTENSNALGWANLSESKRHHNLIYKVGKEKASSRKDVITVYERDGKTKKVDRRLLTPENISLFLQNAVKKDRQPFTKEGIAQSPTARKLARDIGEYMKQDNDEDDDFSKYKEDDFSQYKVD